MHVLHSLATHADSVAVETVMNFTCACATACSCAGTAIFCKYLKYAATAVLIASVFVIRSAFCAEPNAGLEEDAVFVEVKTRSLAVRISVDVGQ